MNRFAVFSDIHSNVWALDAVLSDAKSKGTNHFINLGDILYGPLAPSETYERLQRETIVTIKGNQDRQIYQATPADIDSNPTLKFILAELGPQPLKWMQSLPSTKSMPQGLFLCHGTPSSDMVYMLEDVTSGNAVVKTDKQIYDYVRDVSEHVILCGHTHIPRAVTLSDGKLIINPGSVGLPAYSDNEPVMHRIENHSHHASYCIIEQYTDSWQVEFIRVPYDYLQAVAAAKSRDRHDWAYALATGRVAQ